MVARWYRTLLGALSPAGSAPAFARPDMGPAVRFLLWTALPLSLIVGVIPHTRTLIFEGAGQVSVVGEPTAFAIGLDVARSMGVQLVIHAMQLLAFVLPYRSLTAAYGGADRAPYAVRAALYRAWLLPMGQFVEYAVVALTPVVAEPPSLPALAVAIMLVARLGGMVLFTLSMIYAARLSGGLGMLWSVVAVSVALVLAAICAGAADSAAHWLLPALPQATSS